MHDSTSTPPQDDACSTQTLKFLRIPEVCARLGVKRSTVYGLLASGDFPAPAKIGSASVWAEAEIETYMAARLAARKAQRAA